MGSSFQNLVAPTQNLGASGDRAPVRQQPCSVTHDRPCLRTVIRDSGGNIRENQNPSESIYNETNQNR